jgi:hypothetical protein
MDEFLPVDIGPILGWCHDWPADQWPVISRASLPPWERAKLTPPLPPGPIRMSAVDKWEWNALVLYAEPIVDRLMDHFPDCEYKKPWLSACFPGFGVDFHTDKQPDNFVTRIHCPIITNPDARVNVEGSKYFPKVGSSYKIDTRRTHGVKNDGKEIRIHFIFDVMRKE